MSETRKDATILIVEYGGLSQRFNDIPENHLFSIHESISMSCVGGEYEYMDILPAWDHDKPLSKPSDDCAPRYCIRTSSIMSSEVDRRSDDGRLELTIRISIPS